MSFAQRIQKSKLQPNRALAMMLFAWWVLNLLEGAFLELTNDEAYYWSWIWCRGSQGAGLEWGYFDHPPMVALGIWLSRWIPGGLGVRFIAITLQPIYLWLFWDIIRPKAPSFRDAATYFLLCFSIPVLQLYGLLSLPDAYLLFSSALFLWAFLRLEQSWWYALLTGFAIALLGYSKYHGVLVVIFTIAANLSCLKSKRFYVAIVLAALLYLPHLYWQYQHDFVSFSYHLQGRNRAFELENITDFLFSILFIFNPLFVYHYIKGFTKTEDNTLTKTSRWMVAGFLLFFALSSLRGYVQAQWVLPIVFALIWLLMKQTYADQRIQRYVLRVGNVCLVLMIVARILLVTNPLALKGELWDNQESNNQIANVAQGRMVLFPSDYGAAAKYAYYTHQPTSSISEYYTRESQWMYSDVDDLLAGSDVIVKNDNATDNTPLTLANGDEFNYVEVKNYHPLRRIKITATNTKDNNTYKLSIHNPYPYDIVPDSTHGLQLFIYYYVTQRNQPWSSVPLTDTLHAGTTTTLICKFPLKESVPPNAKPTGFGIGYKDFCAGRNN